MENYCTNVLNSHNNIEISRNNINSIIINGNNRNAHQEGNRKILNNVFIQ